MPETVSPAQRQAVLPALQPVLDAIKESIFPLHGL